MCRMEFPLNIKGYIFVGTGFVEAGLFGRVWEGVSGKLLAQKVMFVYQKQKSTSVLGHLKG